RYGVRVNTVNPGPVNTDRWDGLEKAFARDKGVDQARAHELAVGSIPFSRICEPEEVANLVAFLASARASFINRAHIPIDGAQRKALRDTGWAPRVATVELHETQLAFLDQVVEARTHGPNRETAIRGVILEHVNDRLAGADAYVGGTVRSDVLESQFPDYG